MLSEMKSRLIQQKKLVVPQLLWPTRILELCKAIPANSSKPTLDNVVEEDEFEPKADTHLTWAEYSAVSEDEADKIAANHARTSVKDFIWRCIRQTQYKQTKENYAAYKKWYPQCFKLMMN